MSFTFRHPFVQDFAMNTTYDIASVIQSVGYNDESGGTSNFCNCECGVTGTTKLISHKPTSFLHISMK